MRNILFVVPAFFENRPQSIRFRILLRQLVTISPDYSHYVLFAGNVKKVTEYNYEGINIIEYPGHFLGKKINKYYYPSGRYHSGLLLRYGMKFLRFILKRILFPDLYMLELHRLKKQIKKYHRQLDFKVMVGSASPFTNMKLGRFIKKLDKDVRWLFDTGDPFYMNSAQNKSWIRNQMAKKFEESYLKYIDVLIVTNSGTKEHYLRSFPSIFQNTSIAVIPMGGLNDYIKEDQKFKLLIKDSSILRMVYAGIFYRRLREPFELFKALNTFNRKNSSKIHLDIYGQNMSYYSNRSNITLDDKIIFKGAVNHEDIVAKYMDYDIILHIDNAYGMQTPGKDYELLCIPKPIIFLYTRKSDSYMLFSQIPSTFLVKNTFKDIILWLENMSNDEKEFSFVKPKEIINNNSWKSRAKDLMQLID